MLVFRNANLYYTTIETYQKPKVNEKYYQKIYRSMNGKMEQITKHRYLDKIEW